ncbi:MAG: hypothetical protein LBR45_02410, partial [Bacteroidales bacterium]|nr:hypothetical protein [Bacteroidales bacterium]
FYSDEYWVFLQGADLNDSNNAKQISQFITDTQISSVYKKIKKTYKDNEDLGLEFGSAFDQIRNIFPHFQNPQVYTYISYFDVMNRVIYFDSILWISLDLYVPENTEQYSSFGIPQYLSRRLLPEYLVPDAVRSIGERLIPQIAPPTSLLDYIVAEGKILCFMEEVLPETDKYLLLGYSPKEWAWCKNNEKKIWGYLASENLIYETNLVRIRRFISDGPTGLAFEGAPSRLSQFIGLMLVKRYLRNTDNNWELLLEQNSTEVLTVSKYKP